MSMFIGYSENDDKCLTKKGGTMEWGELNMNFYPLRNVAAPSEDYDAISSSYFLKHIRSQSVLYKYLGFAALNVKHAPDYNHGNYRGSDILHSKNYTSESKIYLHDISLGSDSTNYYIKLRFYARLIYNDGGIADYDISSGGIELKSRPNYPIAFIDITARWFDTDIEVPLRSITGAPEDVRFIIIIAEQVRGVVGGQEFAIHCEVREH